MAQITNQNFPNFLKCPACRHELNIIRFFGDNCFSVSCRTCGYEFYGVENLDDYVNRYMQHSAARLGNADFEEASNYFGE